FNEVPAGDLTLLAFRADTYEQTKVSAFLQEGQHLDLTLVLPGSGGTVTGLVVDALGNPVANAKVAGGPVLTQADELGLFTLNGLPVGTYTIFAQAPESRAVGRTSVTLVSGADVQAVVIRLEATGNINGRVLRSDGVTPVTNQLVQLWFGPNQG